MSTDWREKEREFLAGLLPDTGRDLAQWIELIRAQRLPHRNDIIDWLRHQGFTFSRASWLERIHHNGGKPVYLDPSELDAPAAVEADPPEPAPPPASEDRSAKIEKRREPERAAEPVPQMPITPLAPASQLQAGPSPLAEVLAKAKAYRPLATYVLRELEIALPKLTLDTLGGSAILLGAPHPFGILAVSGKDLRLALALQGAAAERRLEPVKLPPSLARSSQNMTHMIVLTDVRQIDDTLIGLAKSAAEHSGGTTGD